MATGRFSHGCDGSQPGRRDGSRSGCVDVQGAEGGGNRGRDQGAGRD